MSYDNVVKALLMCGSRRYWRDCRRCPYDGKGCHAKLDTDAADAIKELNKNWKYCSDMLNLALKVSGLSMTALVKLYETETQE